jgi:uncharacterized protein
MEEKPMPESSTEASRAVVKDFFQRVHRIVADGEYAVAEWTTHARTRDGRCYESDYAGVFQVAGGRVAAVTEYLDTDDARQLLFSN